MLLRVDPEKQKIVMALERLVCRASPSQEPSSQLHFERSCCPWLDDICISEIPDTRTPKGRSWFDEIATFTYWERGYACRASSAARSVSDIPANASCTYPSAETSDN